MTDVVVVESPSKAKTINKYLGDGFKVLASYGHIRDLPSKNGSVRPDEDFSMDWEVDDKSRKQIKDIAEAVKGADRLYLATDPDREGEAISWHVQEVLANDKLLDNVEVKRVVFNEITKSAILDAFTEPRELDMELVDAYLARRALDYLVGFTLSPVLWRKLPGSRSAGRVQSVALRLICERETEIEKFDPVEYWSVETDFLTAGGQKVTAQLTHLNNEKLDKLTLGNEEAATAAVNAILAHDFAVSKIERKQSRRNPAAPFTTSTLQQEAARKLHFSARQTMQVAQRLYEGITIDGETVGLITYMRTDGVQMAGEAITSCRDLISANFGAPYLPESPRIYKSKAKNAQEAHEAVRPTDVTRKPEDLPQLKDDEKKLYELIWKRTLASQMNAAILDQVAADIRPRGSAQGDNAVTLRATGSVIAFDGFLKVYQESQDDKDEEQRERILPNINEQEALDRQETRPDQHFTQPPPRFSEASLVKRLEELGIGRPSTYASIISVLQDRSYVRVESRRFFPEDRGRLVTAFLSSFFTRYVEYDFTADLEEKLDLVSDGKIEWKSVLRDFWETFHAAVDETKDLRVREVLDALNVLLGDHLFPETEAGADPRKCPSCDEGQLSLKLGKFGAFVGCSKYPECRHTRPLVAGEGDGSDPTLLANGPKELGIDPETELMVTLRRGPYGFYVQRGELEGKKKPKRASLTKEMDPAEVDLKVALGLLSLPRDLGPYPETGEMIQAGLGRFGPYLKLEGTYVSLKEDNVLEIGLNRAIALLADAPKKPAPIVIGDHPKNKKPITMRMGRYGPFVQHGQKRATIPKDEAETTPTLERALELLAAKDGKTTKKKTAAASKKKTTASAKKKKKAPAKKKAAPEAADSSGDEPTPVETV